MAAWLHNHFDIMNALQREVPPQGKTNQHFTVCAPAPRSPSDFMKVSLLLELQSVCDTISTNHPHPARQLQPGTTSCFFVINIYIFMFYFLTAVARTPEAWKALPSDSRRKWTKNVILHYVGGKRWSWELEGRKTSVRLFLSVWGHAARTRADTCRRSVCLQVCEEPLSVTSPYVCFLWSQSHSARGKVHHGTWLQKINKQTAAERGAK